jgi:hypothetical protein
MSPSFVHPQSIVPLFILSSPSLLYRMINMRVVGKHKAYLFQEDEEVIGR